MVRMNTLSDTYKDELARGMSLRKEMEELKGHNASLHDENSVLKTEMVELQYTIENLKAEITKLEKLKDKLEENLKEELMKRELMNEEIKGE